MKATKALETARRWLATLLIVTAVAIYLVKHHQLVLVPLRTFMEAFIGTGTRS